MAAAPLLVERALAITEAAYRTDHPNVATCLDNLARILRHLGEFTTARATAERALTIREAAFGQDHPATRRSRARVAELSGG